MTIQRAVHDISIYRGDTPKYIYQLLEVDSTTGEEVPVNISAHTITGQVRRNADSDEVWFTFPIVKEDVANGKFSWKVTKELSEALLPIGSSLPDTAFYDIQMEVSGDVFTFLTGAFKVSRDITRG